MKTYLKLPAIVGILGASALLGTVTVAVPKPIAADKTEAGKSYAQNSEPGAPSVTEGRSSRTGSKAPLPNGGFESIRAYRVSG
jgi:hypothetical protein